MRHGETMWTRQGRIQGHCDLPLSAEGAAGVRAVGRRLAAFLDAAGIAPQSLSCFTSPLARARETMALAQQELGIAELQVNVDGRLSEARFGDWQGLTAAEVKKRFPEERRRRREDRWRFAPAGGDSHADLAGAMSDFLGGLPSRQTALIVTHTGNIRALLKILAGLPEDEAVGRAVPHDAIYAWDGSRLAQA